jgi:hypothetical protein
VIHARSRRRGRQFGRATNIAAALVASVLLLGVLGFGYGTIPALGPALDPGRCICREPSKPPRHLL